jgi:hypothetical protein
MENVRCITAKVLKHGLHRIGVQVSCISDVYLVQRWEYTEKQDTYFDMQDPKCQSWAFNDKESAVIKAHMLIYLAKKELMQWK